MTKPAEERFWAKIRIVGNHWLWIRNPEARYGTFEGTAAHRWAYSHFVGPIPEDMDIDHLCRITKCVNPAHLEPVTRDENNRRRKAAYTAERLRKEAETRASTRLYYQRMRASLRA